MRARKPTPTAADHKEGNRRARAIAKTEQCAPLRARDATRSRRLAAKCKADALTGPNV